MRKININKGKRYQFPTHINDILLPREQSEIMEAFLVIIEPGKMTPSHVHPDTEQLYHVLSGRGRGAFQHADGRQEELTIAPEDVIQVPRNCRHQIFCVGDQPLRYLCVDGFPGGIPKDEPTWEHHYRNVAARLAKE